MSGYLIAKQFEAHESAATVYDWSMYLTPLIVCLDQLRTDKRTIVVCNGVFDLLHTGHVSLFQHARNIDEKNTFVIAALNHDETVTRLKGKGRPYIQIRDRLDMVAALRQVDLAIGFAETTPSDMCSHIKPDYIVKGEEYNRTVVPGAEHAVNGVYYVPMTPFGHTSDLAHRISAVIKRNQR